MKAINKSEVAESIPFDNTSNGFTSEDVQAAIEEAAQSTVPPIDSLTEFETFSSDAVQSTTSNGWITKTGYPYTTDVKSAGTYVIDYSANVGQSDKEKEVGSRVQFREGTTGTWITIGGSDIRNGVSADDAYELRTGFNNITLTTDTEVQIRWQFGQTDDGGTGRIRFASIKIGKVAE